MTNRNLLKEALADAKVVKEMATANAKALLEEAFAPQLKAILEQKIMDLDEQETEDEDVVTEVTADEDEDVSLEELLRELEGDEDSETEDVETETETETDVDDDTEDSETDEDEELDFDTMTAEELEDFIANVVDDMINNGEIEAGHEGMEDEMGADGAPDMTGGEFETDEMDIEDEGSDDLEIEDDEESFEAEPVMEVKKKKGVVKKVDEKSKMVKALKEAYRTIESLRGELKEINLLNSKLLYTNKIFKGKNLTEANKIKVLSAFDKATTLREVKLVYNTLSESLLKPTITNTKTTKGLVRESKGYSSKPTGHAPTRNNTQPVLNWDETVKRMQKIAGL